MGGEKGKVPEEAWGGMRDGGCELQTWRYPHLAYHHQQPQSRTLLSSPAVLTVTPTPETHRP